MASAVGNVSRSADSRQTTWAGASLTVRSSESEAESEFAQDVDDVRKFVSRASSVSEMLTVALIAFRTHKPAIENAVPDGREIAWPALNTSAQASIRRMADIMLAYFMVLALPITLNWSREAPEDALGTPAIHEDSALQNELRYEVGAELSELENEFIDYVIQEAFAQVAR